MSDFDTRLNDFFNKLDDRLQNRFPQFIAETATEHFKESFKTKSFDGIAWPLYGNPKREPSRGSLMQRSSALFNSIRPSLVSPQKVTISAGNARVPYARIHNEGGVINRASRSETFVRNRHTEGKLGKMFGGLGAFSKGTSSGKGLTFKAYKINMPQRQFMGKSISLLNTIQTRFKTNFKDL